jgi:hypothetical protein
MLKMKQMVCLGEAILGIVALHQMQGVADEFDQ